MIRKHFHDVVFDGKSLADFGVHVSGSGVFSAPERDYETVEVPGKSGDLLFDKGRYKNMTVSYPAFVADDFHRNMEGLRNFLGSRIGYKKLEDSYHPDSYRLATFVGPLDLEAILLRAANFDLEFNCKPQRFLKSGEIQTTFTANGVLRNPASFSSKPLIRVYGNGSFGVGHQTMTIANNTGYTDIDCELMDCYYGSTNRNGNVTLNSGDFPTLEPGTNGVTLGGGITRIIITPRWWIL